MTRPVIVQKFGGTSVEDAAAIERIGRIVETAAREAAPVVVVSAMGKTTDRLVGALERACAGDAAGALARVRGVKSDTAAVVRDLFGPVDEITSRIDPLFASLESMASAIAVLASAPDDARDLFLAHGELIASWVVARALGRHALTVVRVDARDVLVTDARFGRAQPNLERTKDAAAERLGRPAARGEVPVVGGFVGATPGGKTTVLGRGGSDYSAAVFGAVLGASLVEIWTDVDGLMTADPRIVPKARGLDRLSAEEASELAYFGAKVLHPLTLAPAIERGIPVRVRNSRRPQEPGTEISAGPAAGGEDVRSIACKRGISTVDVSTSRMLMESGFLSTLFQVFARHDTSVDMVSTSEVSVSVTVDDTGRLPDILRELEQLAKVDVERGRAIVCLVGENLKFTPGIAARIFRAVEGMNVLMISQGASRRNVSFVVADEDAERAVRLLHAEFFGS